MLKGHVEIELHNHKTGLRDRIEQDNLVTNATNYLIDYIMGRDGDETKIMPIYAKALGGLMIFEDPLVESVNNITFPVGNFLTGYAGRSVNTDDTERGSINNIDSCEVPGGYMTVWDFATSQANGLISSMALTHSTIDAASPIPGSIISSAYIHNLGVNRALIYDNKYAYYTDKSNGDLVKVCYMPSRDYLVTDVYQTRTVLNEVVEEGVFNATTNSWMDGGDGKYYSVLNSSTKSNSLMKLDLIAINSTTYQRYATYHITITAKDASIDHFYMGSDWKNINTDKTYIVSKGNLYISEKTDIQSGGETLICYKIFGIDLSSLTLDANNEATVNLTDSDSICEIVDPLLPAGASGAYLYPSIDGAVAIRYGTNVTYSGSQKYQKWAAAKLNGSLKIYSKLADPSNLSNVYGRSTYNGDILGVRPGTNVGYNNLDVSANYLGTICNLETPFEKTVSTSMKVKYTLVNV